MHQETILLLDGDESVRGEHLQRLQEAGYLVQEELSDPLGSPGVEHPPELVVASMPLSTVQKKQIEHLSSLDSRPFFLFLLSPERAQDATDALELGADDMLQRPFTTHDLRARLQLLAERRRRENIGRPGESGTGRIEDVRISELVQLFQQGHGTATVHLQSQTHRGKLYFREGALVAVVVNHQHGLPALVRAIRWQEGHFEITPNLDENELPALLEHSAPLQAAEQAVARWDELLNKLPPTSLSIQVDFQQVQQHLDELNDRAEQLLWQLASHSSLEAVIDDLDGDLVEALSELCNLYEKGYFTTRTTESVSGVLSESNSISLENFESNMSQRTSQGGGFSDRLADAAREAAAQLMAAAQPVSNPSLPRHPERYPSFADMEAREHRSSESFAQMNVAPHASDIHSDEYITSALFPLDPEPQEQRVSVAPAGHSEPDDSFALGDFKNLSTDPIELPLDPSSPFETTVPSIEAASPEDLGPIQIETAAPDGALPPIGDPMATLSFLESVPPTETEEAAPSETSTPSSEADLMQMLQSETMGVLDQLLENQLSSISQADAVAAPSIAPEAVASPPKQSSSSPLAQTMAFGESLESLAAQPQEPPAPPKKVSAPPVQKTPEPKPKAAPTPASQPVETAAPARIQLNPDPTKASQGLSLDDLPAAQKGHFPSMSLSDEFFLKEEDLRPVKSSKWKEFATFGIVGLVFILLGFFGMNWYVNQQKTQNIQKQQTTSVRAGVPIRPMVTRTAPTPVRPPKPLRLNPVAAPDAGPSATAPDQAPKIAVDTKPTVRRPAPVVRPVVRPVARPVVRKVIQRPVVRKVAKRPVVRKVVRKRPQPRRRKAPANNERTIRRLLSQGLRLKRRERFPQAERLLRRALKLKPRRPAPIYSALGQVLYEREKTGAALGYLSRAYRISARQTGDGLVTLGSIYYEKGQRSKAKKIYRQYLRYFPRGRNASDVKAMLKN